MSSQAHHSTLVEEAKLLKKAYFQAPNDHRNSEQFKKMFNLVESISLENFKIPAEFPAIPTEGVIYKEFGLRVSIFFIPKGTKTFLHDHPKMYVINKILKGSFKRYQYALENPAFQKQIPQKYIGCSNPTDSFEFPIVNADRVVDIVNVGHMEIVTPENNLHRFETQEDSIFLDVIAPDYDGIEIFYNTYEECEDLGGGKVRLQMGPPKMQENYMIKVQME